MLAQASGSDGGAAGIIILILWLGFWLLFGYAGSRIARSKGISEGAGWALGMLLGVIGLLILALMKDRRGTPPAPFMPPPPVREPGYQAKR